MGRGKLQHFARHPGKALGAAGNHRQQLAAELLGEVADGNLRLLQFFLSGVHLRRKLVLHRACGFGFVANEAKLAVVLGERANHQRDVVRVLLSEQFGERDGALLVVEFFETA